MQYILLRLCLEGAVAVGVFAGAFPEDLENRFAVELRCEFRTVGVLHAVVGPHCLLQPVHKEDIAGLVSGMLADEGAVVGGMPVLGG